MVRHSLDIRHSSLGLLALLLLLFTAGGSACPWMRTGGEILPVTLPETATLEQLTVAVNDNTARVQSLLATQATISLPGAPTLPVNLALEPPLRLRLRASVALIGPMVDLGSNDELFWFWIKQSQPPALYYCRHDQFAGSAARRIMPVEPEWLVEALGLVRFDPADLPQGPTPVGSGRVQIQSVRHSAVGELTKITVIDPARAIVLEQDLYDVRRQLVAAARTSAHRRDPVTGAILPRHIEIDYPSAQLTMKIDIADWQVNALGPQNAQYWTEPDYAGYQKVNLADPNILAQPGGFAPQPGPMTLPGAPLGQPSSAPSLYPAPATGAPAWPQSPPPSSGYAPPQGAIPATPSGYRSPRFSPYP
ncbi:MAG TPA: hypothetical protein VG056_17645 [Pirellulales bacterium]|nr:hypothetical protein [Pirellulales bacterium]